MTQQIDAEDMLQKKPAADRKSLICWVCATCLDTAITRPLASALIARVIKQNAKT